MATDTDQRIDDARVDVATRLATVQGLLRQEDALTPDERIAAETMIRDGLEEMVDRGTVSIREMEALGPDLKNRLYSASNRRQLKEAYEAVTAPARALNSLQIAAADEMYNLAAVSLDLVGAGLSVVTDPEGRTQAAIDNKRQQLKNSQVAMRGMLEADFVEAYGADAPDSAIANIAQFAGDIAGRIYPYAYMPARGATWTRTVLYNTLIGGAAGAAADHEAKSFIERLDGMGMGALTGAFVSGTLNARQGVSAAAARRVERELSTRFSEETALLEQRIRQLQQNAAHRTADGTVQGFGIGDEPFSYSLGQITANPFIVGLEVGAARTEQRARQVQRLAILRDILRTRANALHGQGRAPAEVLHDLQQTADDVISGIRKVASDEFDDALSNVIAQWGDDAIVTGRHYHDRLGELLEEWTRALGGGSSKAAPQFLLEQHNVIGRYVNPFRYRRTELPDGSVRHDVVDLRQFGEDFPDAAVDDLIWQASGPKLFPNARDAAAWASAKNAEVGGLNAEQTKTLLRGFNAMIAGNKPLFEGATPGSQMNLAMALKRAFINELEMGVKNPEARDAVMSLRDVFAHRATEMEYVRRTVVTDLLGNVQQMGHRALLQSYLNRDPKELAQLREFLLKHDETLLQDLQRTEIERILSASIDPNMKASLGDVSIYQLGVALAGQPGRPGSFAAGLWSPVEQLENIQLGKALQRLQETHLNLFPEASGEKLADAAINVKSQSGEFVARWLTRLAVKSGAVSKWINDPQVRRSVIEVANNPVGSYKYQLASAVLAMYAAESLAEDKMKEEAAARQQEVQELTERHLADPMRQ